MATSFERLLLGLQPQQPPDDGPLPEEPEGLRGAPWGRQVQKVVPALGEEGPQISSEELRVAIDRGVRAHLAHPAPDHVLLIPAPPGSGKTTLTARIVEDIAGTGERVLYLGPRHAFFEDLLRAGRHPGLWYEWMPRQTGDKGKVETCRHAEAVAAWMQRGYRGWEFCRQVCIRRGTPQCRYHAQAKTDARIIFGQHQHLFGGHPMQFRMLIGDECPVGAACWEWWIPTKHMVPPQMPTREPFTEMLFRMQGLSERGDMRLAGKPLLEALGGVEEVTSVLERSVIPLDIVAAAPSLRIAEDAFRAPYFHLPALGFLLGREARAAKAGKDYPARVILTETGLILLLRRRPQEKLPRKQVWLDATANERIYRAILGQPVQVLRHLVKARGQIVQVYDRANGKGSFVDRSGARKPGAVSQLRRQVKEIARGYSNAGIITHRVLEDEFPEMPLRGHFAAERGTNRFQDVDCLIVAGTPQPPLPEIEKMARMIFLERMEPFDTTWTAQLRPYTYLDPDEGQPWEERGRAYPCSGYWKDADLQAVLEQVREAEVLQAAHRARPNNRDDVTVYLLTNLPIPGLPITQLKSIREVMGAPEGVDVFRWPDVKAFADLFWEQGKPITTTTIMEWLEVARPAAVKYQKLIQEMNPERWVSRLVKAEGSKQPVKALVPKNGGRDAEPF